MKYRLLLVLLLFWALVGCQTAVPQANNPTPTPFTCQEPGQVMPDQVEETSRGYAYSFQIYLPPCYERDSEQDYPVLYLLPGNGGSPASWFSAGVSQVADDLIHSGQVPPFLIVSTESTSIDPYGELIYNDLLPYVETEYRVRHERPYRAVGGGSLGGVGAYRLGLQHPDQFSSIALFGSGLINGEETAVQSWLHAIPSTQRPRLFFNTGEQDPLMLAQAEAMIPLLEAAHLETKLIVSPGGHDYGYWVSNLPIYFQWLAQEW